MKTICLLIFILLSGGNLFAQKRNEYLQFPKDSLREFPYLCSQISIYVTQEEPQYLQEKDSVTGALRVVPNELHEGWDESWNVSKNPYRYVSLFTYSPIDLPPVLDSLPDGWYVQYYVPLPVLDNDTLKWVEDKVAAIFQLQNNLPVGKVRWYYPQDGLLFQEGAYLDGMRTGEWFVQQVEGAFLNEVIWVENYSVQTCANSFEQGQKTGLEHEYQHYYLFDESPRDTIAFIDEKYVHYRQDTLHGDYLHLINGKPLTKGSFYKGTPIGHWEQYQWKDSLYGGELIPWMNYTYATDSMVYKRPYLVRNLKTERFRNTMNSYPENIDMYYYGNDNYESINLAIKQGFNDDFDDFLEIRNCLQQPIKERSVETIPYFLSLGQWTQFFGYARTDVDAEYCGFHFPFAGIAEEYYANGQLKWQLNFNDPETLFNDTVYWRNGQPLNSMRRTKSGYEQLWYDENGTIIEHIAYTDKLVQTDILLDPNVRMMNGRKYNRTYANVFTYNHPNVVRVSDTSAVLVNSTINDYRGTSQKDLWYVPSERRGWQETTLGTGVWEKVTFQIDSTNQLYDAQSEVRCGNYTVYGTLRDTLFPNRFPTAGKSLLAGDTVLIHSLNFPYVSGKIQDWVVSWKGKPFKGKVIVSYDQKKPFLIRKKAGKLLVHMNDSSVMSGYKLFPGTGEYLFGNYPPPKKLATEPDTILRKALEEATLAKVELSYKNGRLDGKSGYYGTNGCALALLHYEDNKMHGIQVTTRLFPHLFWRHYSDNEFMYHYFDVSELNGVALTKRQMNHGQVLSELIMDGNGDTLHFNQWNGIVSDGYFVRTTSYSEEKATGFYKNGELLSERVVNKKGIVTSLSDYQSRAYQIFDEKGRPIQRLHMREDAATDTLFCFDTLGFVRMEQVWKKQVLSSVNMYQNGLLTTTFTCNLTDSSYFADENMVRKEDLSSMLLRKRYIHRDAPTGYLKFYLPDGSCWREGALLLGFKKGNWNYYPQTGSAYQINYDSVLEDSYVKRYFPKLSAPGVKAVLLDYNEEYNCLQNEHSEQYVPSFSLLNGQLPPDTAVQIVWYYPTGVKMCEGPVVNGKPHGMWRLYHTDGSLHSLGTYQQGKREGRWISGDLSKVNFLGEYCLHPEEASYDELLNALQVSTLFYRDGKVISRSGADFRIR